jgi:hypothetical protein
VSAPKPYTLEECDAPDLRGWDRLRATVEALETLKAGQHAGSSCTLLAAQLNTVERQSEARLVTINEGEVMLQSLRAQLEEMRGQYADALSKLLAIRLERDALKHAVWHALDDSEEHANGERTISKRDSERLCALVPEDHP